MFSYKTYEMTQNAIIDQIQKYATEIFTIETQNMLDQNQQMSLSLSQSHSLQSIPNYQEQHEYPDENQPQQINIGRHIFGRAMANSSILSDYNRSQNIRIDPIDLKMIKNHNKNIHTQRSPRKNRKKGRYAQNYVSPYNKREVNSTARSYMSKGYINPSKQSSHMKYIKKKINEQIQPEISYRKHQETINKQKNQKLLKISSKYKQTKPLMDGYLDYMNEHIYKKQRNQMNYLMQLQKKGQSRTKQELQYSWNVFIQKQKQFKEIKKQRIRQKQVQLMEQEQRSLQIQKIKMEQAKLKKQRNGLTVEEYIMKLKRQKQKMKQRLYTGQISNFMTKSFQNQRFQTNKDNKFKFKSVLGVSIQQNFSTIRQDSSENINQMSQLQNKIRNTILKQEFLLNKKQYPNQSFSKSEQTTALNKILHKRSKDISIQKEKKTPKKVKSKSKNISQLLNPKYFKSINELQEYSTSKSKQKKSFQERQKLLSYRNKLQQRNSRLYGFDPKIMQISIEQIRKNQQLYRQYEQGSVQRRHDPMSYRNISNLYPSTTKNQNQIKVRDLSTDSKIRHFEQRFRKHKTNQIYQNQKIKNSLNGISNTSVIVKKPGSFSYQQKNSLKTGSPLVKVNATDMNFLFDSSNLQ